MKRMIGVVVGIGIAMAGSASADVTAAGRVACPSPGTAFVVGVNVVRYGEVVVFDGGCAVGHTYACNFAASAAHGAIEVRDSDSETMVACVATNASGVVTSRVVRVREKGKR